MKKYVIKVDGVRQECNEEDAQKILKELEKDNKYHVEKYEIENVRIVIAHQIRKV